MPNVSRPQMTSVANPPVVAGNIQYGPSYKMQYQKRSTTDKSAVKYTGFLPLEGVYEEVSRLPCNPCLFFRSPFGCKKGAACAFCHHEVTTRAQANLERPRQAERLRIRVSILELFAKLDVETQQPQDIVHQLQLEAQASEYARCFCQTQLAGLLHQLQETLLARGLTLHKCRHQGTCGALLCFSV